jgi:hypothetical protein
VFDIGRPIGTEFEIGLISHRERDAYKQARRQGIVSKSPGSGQSGRSPAFNIPKLLLTIIVTIVTHAELLV